MTAVPAVLRAQWVLVPILVIVAVNTGPERATVVLPPNNYTVAEEVELGKEAATEARTRLPPMTAHDVNRYVEDIGHRVADSIPADFRQPAWQYSFEVVNLREIASFALPGGPILVSRGMIEVARTEGELAGILSHQLSHIILRHGTAQVTKGERFQVGVILGRTIGAVVGSTGDSIVGQGANFGVSTYFLMYGHEFEHQADLLATQVMARAGYDPRDIAEMFHAIESQGAGRGGPQWMRSHPNPGTRDEYLGHDAFTRSAPAMPRVEEGIETPNRLESIQATLAAIPGGQRTTHVARWEEHGVPTPSVGNGRGVDVPSGELGTVRAGDALYLDIPVNWRRILVSNTAIFAPDRAFVNSPGGTVLTHGVQVGIARGVTGSLKADTDVLLTNLAQGNPHLRWISAYQRVTLRDRSGLTTTASNVSPVTGQFEQVQVSTWHVPDGGLLHVISIAPQNEAGVYRNAFNRILESIQVVN